MRKHYCDGCGKDLAGVRGYKFSVEGFVKDGKNAWSHIRIKDYCSFDEIEPSREMQEFLKESDASELVGRYLKLHIEDGLY